MGVFLQDGVSDVYISGMKDRNRALNGDIVVVQVNTRDQWKVSLVTANALEAAPTSEYSCQCYFHCGECRCNENCVT